MCVICKICVLTVRQPTLIFGPDPYFLMAMLVEII